MESCKMHSRAISTLSLENFTEEDEGQANRLELASSSKHNYFSKILSKSKCNFKILSYAHAL